MKEKYCGMNIWQTFQWTIKNRKKKNVKTVNAGEIQVDSP